MIDCTAMKYGDFALKGAEKILRPGRIFARFGLPSKNFHPMIRVSKGGRVPRPPYERRQPLDKKRKADRLDDGRLS